MTLNSNARWKATAIALTLVLGAILIAAALILTDLMQLGLSLL